MSRILSLACPWQMIESNRNLYHIELCCAQVFVEAERQKRVFDGADKYVYTEFEVLWLGSPEEMEARYGYRADS